MKLAAVTGAASLLLTLLIAPRLGSAAAAQDAPAPPVNGMRPAELHSFAITNVTVIPSPGQKIEHATIVIHDGAIESVGPADAAKVPAGAQVFSGEGLTVYAGLIEPALLATPAALAPSAGAHWNAKIRPEIEMSIQAPPDRATRKDLRSLGFTTAAVYPDSGELRGSGTVLSLSDEDKEVRTYRERAAMMAGFDYGFGGFRAPATPPTTPATPGPGNPRNPGTPADPNTPATTPDTGQRDRSGAYPSSLMGAIALMRQTLLDAQWYAQCQKVWAAHPQGNEPPPPQDALDALQDVISGRQPILFECSDESNELRADHIAREFNLDLWLLGNGLEFRKLDEVVATKRPILLPLDFPRRPEVGTLSQADNASLQDLMTWEQAPTDARRLIKAGATVALTTYRLRSKADFPANLRSAIKHGLSEEQALAALTTTPAKLLGIDSSVGTVEAGKIANLVVVKGNLFDKDAKIRDVWVNGKRSEISADPKLEVKGTGALKIEPAPEKAAELSADVDSSRSSITLTTPDRKRHVAKHVAFTGDQVSFLLDGEALGTPGGYVHFTGVVEKTPNVEKGYTISGKGAMADGKDFTFTLDLKPRKPGERAPDDNAGGAAGDNMDNGGGAGAGGEAAGAGEAAVNRDPVSGDWTLAIEAAPDMAIEMALKLEAGNAVSGSVTVMGQTMPLDSGHFDPSTGKLQLNAPTSTGEKATIEATIKGNSFTGTASGPQGEMQIVGTRAGSGNAPAGAVAQAPPAGADEPSPQQPGQGRRGQRGQRPGGARGPGGFGGRGGPGGAGDAGGPAEEAPFEMPPENLNHPFGEYGAPEPPKSQNVLLTNATIWTSSPDGIIQKGWMLVRDGKIAALGKGDPDLDSAKRTDLLAIDCTGKHITPGIIDCHSHTGIDGGVNEGTQSNTAECRIGDCIDPDDIAWYRELAGGTTAANQLHGSANPIGGQNSPVKIKWGRPASDFPIAGAIPGIKFALGENVKRSNGRYPNTRMGVETFDRDAFTAAKDYKAQWARYNALAADAKSATIPPRRDLETDAIAEVLDGKRIIHCHSYRQDEILMLIRLADDFGFKIGTFQHGLEGYKVADAIAKHGAGVSTFSDWWAYKIEVIDAVPYNGSLMEQVGVVVSFNSDSDELARRLNWEAAKAVRYGGIAPDEALKFVTINPAKQLRIDSRTGSLEKGKDADFVVWSGDPLSTYSRCEQTWIEGAKYFDIEADHKMREDVDKERQRLIQKILRQANGEPAKIDAKSQATSGSQPSPPASRPGTLLARMLQQYQDWADEQIRLGRNPSEMQPGSCGCQNNLDMIYNDFGGGDK